MPTTVQQVETLPEGLVTLESVNPKVPLIETIAQAEAPKEETPAPETLAVETLTEFAPATVTTTTTTKTTTETNVDLFETPKHVIKCSEKFDKASMEVNIVKEKQFNATQRCFILTVHDIGFDNSQFDEFIKSQYMSELRSRTVWLNVCLPGQEIEATDLSIQKYPTFEELADELVTILDYFKLSQVVLLGEGVGATICTHFAMKYPTKCHGLMCIEPIVSSASYLESIKYKLQNLSFTKQSDTTGKDKKDAKADETEPTVPECVNENESFHLQPVDNTTHEKFKNRNLKNMSLFAQAFLNRTNLIDCVSKLEIDTLVATNKSSTGYQESKKFYRAINEFNRKNFRSMVNTPFIEMDASTGRILESSTEFLATSFQYFLQGIGLLSAMPLKMSLVRQGSVSSQGKSADETATLPVETESTPEITPAPTTTTTAE